MIYQAKCHIPCLKALLGGMCWLLNAQMRLQKPFLRHPGVKNGPFLQRGESHAVGVVEAMKLQGLWPEAKGQPSEPGSETPTKRGLCISTDLLSELKKAVDAAAVEMGEGDAQN